MSKLSQTNVEVGIESLPVGFIFPVANTNTPPSGTLECNGASISQTTYADLFSGQPLSIGTYYDPTPVAGQFRIPDYRGRFLRGWAHGSSRDPVIQTGQHEHPIMVVDQQVMWLDRNRVMNLVHIGIKFHRIIYQHPMMDMVVVVII
jgi:hypothetical protein